MRKYLKIHVTILKMSHTLVYKSKTKQGNVAMMAKFAEKGIWNA